MYLNLGNEALQTHKDTDYYSLKMQFMSIVVDWIMAEDVDFVSSKEGAED